MFDAKQFVSAIKQISEEKGIPEESVIETVEAAIAAAYKRDYGKKGQIVRAKLNMEEDKLDMTQYHYVIEGADEEGYITGELPKRASDDKGEGEGYARHSEEGTEIGPDNEIKIKFNPEKYILLEDAKKIKKGAKVGDEIITKLETKTDFGRVAAQTAKQVVIQRLREAERDAIFAEFKGREGEVVSGAVQRREGALVFVDLGKTNGILPIAEQMPNDNYRIGQRLRFMILRVEEASHNPVVVLSRSHPRLVLGLFRMEVPEIESGSVSVEGIAREAGSRTKIAVISKEEGVDPIGSLVGQRGVRVQTVINELSGEKIDIILWSDKPKEFIANALSPAKVLLVDIVDEKRRNALVEVTDDQFSLAIGKHGQNVRLAAKLTEWRIDVRSPKEKMVYDEAVPEEAVKAVVEEQAAPIDVPAEEKTQ